MSWLKNIWFKLKILIVIIMSSINLPTVDDEGEFIDPNRVIFAYIVEFEGKKFIHCLVDGILVFLIHTPALERWFIASGISLAQYDSGVEIGKIFDVKNIPEKYKKEPKPK